MLNKLRTFLGLLTPGEIILIGAFIALLFMGFGTIGDRWGAYRERRAFEKERAGRLKEAQSALALAEAANRRAEAKEREAEALAAQTGQKAATAKANAEAITREGELKANEIEQEYAQDKAYVNSQLSDCDRMRDICRRAITLGFACSDAGLGEACGGTPGTGP